MNLIILIDSSILIDLINIDLLELTCKLTDEIYITDFVQNEISYENQKSILQEFIFSKKIKVIVSNDSQLSDIINFYSIYSSKISISDCSSIYHGKHMRALLLTNDANMKIIAEKEGLKVFRILNIFDLLIQENIINKKEAIEKLNELIKINKRLSYGLCAKKIKEWEK